MSKSYVTFFGNVFLIPDGYMVVSAYGVLTLKTMYVLQFENINICHRSMINAWPFATWNQVRPIDNVTEVTYLQSGTNL